MQRRIGVLLIIISAASFGTLPIFTRLAYRAGAEPITLLALRFALASIVMVAIIAARKIPFPRGRTLLGLVLMGAIGYVGQSLAYFTALTMASAALVALLLYLYPALVTLLSAIFLKEHLTLAKISALAFALVGTALTVEPTGGGRLLGVVLAIASAVIYSIYILAGSRITAHTNAIALVSTVLPIVTFFAGLERLGPTRASTLSTFEPIVSVVLATLVLGETISPLQVLGGALILAAVIICSLT
jgi:drug/metabolite transporter (DMT)-like permease